MAEKISLNSCDDTGNIKKEQKRIGEKDYAICCLCLILTEYKKSLGDASNAEVRQRCKFVSFWYSESEKLKTEHW